MANNRTTIVARIEDYVIAHPRCQSAAIVRELGICTNTVNMTLQRLRAGGCLRRIRVKPDRGPSITFWEAGIEPGIILADATEGAPKQIIVSSWAPLNLPPNPWFGALLYPQPIQQEQA
jgi:hypothetical protein